MKHESLHTQIYLFPVPSSASSASSSSQSLLFIRSRGDDIVAHVLFSGPISVWHVRQGFVVIGEFVVGEDVNMLRQQQNGTLRPTNGSMNNRGLRVYLESGFRVGCREMCKFVEGGLYCVYCPKCIRTYLGKGIKLLWIVALGVRCVYERIYFATE